MCNNSWLVRFNSWCVTFMRKVVRPCQRAGKRRVGELAVWNVKNAYRETNLTVQTVLDWFIDVWCSCQICRWKTQRRRRTQESLLRYWCV